MHFDRVSINSGVTVYLVADFDFSKIKQKIHSYIKCSILTRIKSFLWRHGRWESGHLLLSTDTFYYLWISMHFGERKLLWERFEFQYFLSLREYCLSCYLTYNRRRKNVICQRHLGKTEHTEFELVPQISLSLPISLTLQKKKNQ